MRLVAIFPFLLSLAATILTFLCIFAGHNASFMQDYEIISVNTSRIGYNYFSTASTSSSSSGSLPSWLQPFAGIINGGIQEIEQTIENALNSQLESLARDLGLHDYYSLHVLGYCEGYYNYATGSSTPHPNTTSCSSPSALYAFNLTQILNEQLAASNIPIQLADIAYPPALTESLSNLRWEWRAMGALYYGGAASAGIALITAAVGIFLSGRRVVFANCFAAIGAMNSLIIASAIVTVAGQRAQSVINQDGGAAVNITATAGSKFLALTWSTTVVLMVAAAVWTLEAAKAWRAMRAEKKARLGEVEEKEMRPIGG